MTTDVLILRDPRESIQKCSLTPLRGREDVEFLKYDPNRRYDAAGRILLHHEGELLTEDDAGAGLFLVDSSWRRLPKLLDRVDGEPLRRRLPPLRTAYPRKSVVFEDPDGGLASIEALYAAVRILYGPRPELLEGYRWAEEFLRLNPSLA
jgi:pre-rRNA-processing protein TSR3